MDGWPADLIFELVLLLFLILVNAFFAMSEIAIISLNDTKLKKMAEDGKVAVRSVRRDAIEKLKAMKKDSTITEDDQANGEKKIQTLTDKYCAEIDTLLAAKEKEILEI